MARTDDRFRVAYQELLSVIAQQPIGADLPPELTLADQLSISRTTVRAILTAFSEAGLIAWKGRRKSILRMPTAKDQLAIRDEYLPREELERRFLQWVLRFDVPAGTPLNVAKLAKEFSVPPHALQEFLSGLSQFGLVARRPRGGWLLLGFTAEYAVELSEFRTVLELNAVRVLVHLPQSHPIWGQLARLEQQHIDLAARIDADFHEFSPLDEAFHSAINSVVQNRFVKQFQKVITLIFHYHYQWDKRMERDRNEAAIREHLAIIAAFRSGNELAAAEAASAHLRTSKETLLASLRVNALIAPDGPSVRPE